VSKPTIQRSQKRSNGSLAADRPIKITGARVHNLKNIDVEIPRNSLTVVTGVSGSGKSSLAFDTLYAEGHRRYVESLSSYARQFLERMDKPDVDTLTGISPAMAIQQKTIGSNPRSTVGTTTELYDYVRLLFARIGETFSPISGEKVSKDTPQEAAERLQQVLSNGEKYMVLFPVDLHSEASVKKELGTLLEKGFTRVMNVDNEQVFTLPEQQKEAESIPGEKLRVLVDRLSAAWDEESITRLTGSLETAFQNGAGRCSVKKRGGEEWDFSERFERDGMEFTEPTPQMFSFNNPYGACSRCEGFGRTAGIDEDLVIPDPDKTIRDGAIAPFQSPKHSASLKRLVKVFARHQLPIDTPYALLDKSVQKILWKGLEEYEGVDTFFEEIREQFYKMHMRVFYAKYRGYAKCPECEGYRVRKDALYVKLQDHHIGEVTEMTLGHAKEFFEHLQLRPWQEDVAGQILYEIRKRLDYLNRVGLDYLTLDRATNTLSGGESQRISLANALGSSLIGSLYVLDEPTIGLHPRDNDRLIDILKSLRDIGNTLVVVEHDPEMMAAADHIIDMGPFAGQHGGDVVFAGSYDALREANTLTGRYLSGRTTMDIPKTRRKGKGRSLVLKGASEHNLKTIDVEFPLHRMVCITGVSGSGKSTLVHDTLVAALKKELGQSVDRLGRFHTLEGGLHVYDVEMVDQSPIGRSSRSNPATYSKAFDGIRDVFAQSKQAKLLGLSPGHFSFNVPGGRCEACQGEGVQTIEMQFMADIELVCEECEGARFRKEILQVKVDGHSIHDVLELSISDALDLFKDHNAIHSRLLPMERVGLGYLKLGQSATTLSGGEAQRVKLAKFLTKPSSEHTLYVFDEPTTGLHFEDVRRLLDSFHELVDLGHSVLLIEHNVDIMMASDWIIDLGPEGGFGGGKVIATGTPEEVMKLEESHTGRYLKRHVEALSWNR